MAEKREARIRAKELQPKHHKPEQQPWRETYNHRYEFESDIKRMSGCVLSNTDIVNLFVMIYRKLQYRIHLIPRTYDKTIPPGKDQSFRLTSKFGKEFGDDYRHMLGQQGKTIIERNIKEFQVSFCFI